MEGTSMECQDDDNNESTPTKQTQNDDEDEYEEEEILVHVQFDCDVDTKIFNSEEPKIIGLDTENPIMQMGPQFYRGTWQDTMGTSVFFETDPDPPPLDPIFSRVKGPLLKLACHTRKSLLMSRVFVKPIVGESSDKVSSECVKNKPEDTNITNIETPCATNRTEDTNNKDIIVSDSNCRTKDTNNTDVTISDSNNRTEVTSEGTTEASISVRTESTNLKSVTS